MNHPTASHLLAMLVVLATATTALAQQPTKVRVVKPEPSLQARSYSVPGRVEPYEFTTIFTRATGIVKERRFDIGDAVKAGDVLAIIDVPEIDRDIDSARAAIDQARARYANAKSLADRANALLGSRAISQEEADQRNASAAELDAAVRVAEAELARLLEELNFATVRAPFDGIISGRNFNRGDRVRGDSATSEGWLYRLINIQQLRFVVAAPPDLAMHLKPDTTATVTFAELPGRSITAQIYRQSEVFDQSSGTMRLELLLPNPTLSIPAGLTGTATFSLAPQPGRFVVPANALVVSRGVGSIKIVKDGKVQTLAVTVGRNLGNNIEITSDALSPDLQVIINPNALLRDNEQVAVATEPAPGN